MASGPKSGTPSRISPPTTQVESVRLRESPDGSFRYNPIDKSGYPLGLSLLRSAKVLRMPRGTERPRQVLGRSGPVRKQVRSRIVAVRRRREQADGEIDLAAVCLLALNPEGAPWHGFVKRRPSARPKSLAGTLVDGSQLVPFSVRVTQVFRLKTDASGFTFCLCPFPCCAGSAFAE
jgi:hypothetical protein